MKMRIPPKMPLKMKMMSRWTSYFFSFPFWHLMTKGEWKAIYVLIWACVALVSLCFELMSFLFTFWTSLILCKDYVVWEPCNVCYSVFSYRTWVYSKKFLLVCVLFELTDCCFLFFCVLAQKGWILRATGRIPRIHCPEFPGSYPESPGPAAKHTFSWVNIMSYASHLFCAHTCSPHCKSYKSFYVSLEIYANCWRLWSQKFEIQVHSIH